MILVRKIEGYGSNDSQLYHPNLFTTDPIGRVFTAVIGNGIICIYDTNLNHIRNIMHKSMSRSSDVEISRDRMYVLCR